MASLIPQDFIHNLLAHIDIVEIVSSRVNLRKSGNNFQALCPFHSEKTPSFTVSQRKQFYHCFGCGAHGNAISFLMEFEKLNFVETIETLAAQAGLEVPQTTTAEKPVTELYTLLEKVSTFYQQQLTQFPTALHYLLKERGVSPEVCHKFRLGYSPAEWAHLNQLQTNNPKIKQQLLASGMLSQKDPQSLHYYARFRNRLMFPIRDKRGRIVGFGGRAIGSDTPKYLNSPETTIFHKGSELYGLYEARQSNRNLTQIIVVEGYMDVIALAQHGITNAVATSGTAITPKQTQQLLNNCQSIAFCFDGDTAGKTAAWRALENVLPLTHAGVEIKFLFLPESEDPDTIIRKEGYDAFMHRLATATPLSDFLFQQLLHSININTLDGRAKLIQETQRLLQKMSHGVFKQLLLAKLAEITKVDISTITATEQEIAPRSPLTPSTATGTLPPSLNHVQLAIGLLLNYPDLINAITTDDVNTIANLNTVETSLLARLAQLIKKIEAKQQQNLTLGTILEYWRQQPEAEFTLLARIAAWEPLIPHVALKNEFGSVIQKICEQSTNNAIHTLLQKANTHELTVDEKIKLQNLIKLVKTEKR